MQYPIVPALAAPVMLAITGVQAQTAPGSPPSLTATELGALSGERAARWAESRPVIHCSPAPLTERPGAAAELARPHVAPVEETFLDAAIVKRTLAARIDRFDRGR